jgi:predicted nuclease of restriction endonuclease-like (RecB) superfamily
LAAENPGPYFVVNCFASGWDKRALERQIHSCYYDRMLKSQNPQAMLQSVRQQMSPYQPAVESLKNPYVRRQIFASKYMLYLPTEKELALELERERRLIEAQLADQSENVPKIASASKRKGERKYDKE